MRTDNCSSNLIYNPTVSSSERSSAENKTFMHLSLPIYEPLVLASQNEKLNRVPYFYVEFFGEI